MISVDTVNRAIAVSQWYAGEFTRLFSRKNGIPEEQVDAEILAEWFLTHQNTRRCQWIGGLAYFKTSDLPRYGPSSLRKFKQRLDAALDYLALNNLILFSAMGKTSYVQLVPQNFSNASNHFYPGINAQALGHY